MVGRKLQGQTAIVTGAGRGLGAATALELAQAGARLVLMSRSEDEISAVARTIRSQGGQAIAVVGDVSDLDSVEEVVESGVDQFGRVDILVNNAAVVWPVDEIKDVDPEEWAYNIHINLTGAFFMAQNVLPLMLEQGSGRILNISSGAAASPMAGASAYSAAKAGLEMFARTLATEVAESGVVVTILRPGILDTQMQADMRSIDTSETNLDFTQFQRWHEAGQLVAPERVARLIHWLAGPWGRHGNGQIFDATDQQWVTQVKKDMGDSDA